MKNRMYKWIKRATAALAIVAVMGSVTISTEARGDETAADKVLYECYKNGEYEEYKVAYSTETKKPVPKKDGYVFGGWFTKKDDTTYSPIENMEGRSGDVYAKFVPANVLSVKCQNVAGTNSETPSATMKIVSALDSLNYQSYGFEVDLIRLNDDDNTFRAQGKIQYTYELKDAYTAFSVYEDEDGKNLVERYLPNKLFGESANYFITHGVTNIPKNEFDAIICIKPYWRTIDGTEVYGLTKYAHVEDGLLIEGGYRYVNVPVNLRQMSGISGVAAGVLNVNYSEAKADEVLTFVEVEGGRYFEEMAWADKDTSVKLVGNLSNISSDKNEDDIYANIRFKVSSENAYKVLTGYTFEVNGEDFSTSSEVQYSAEATSPVKYDVWNVQY